MSDYLLLKITVLEQASANEDCRLAEDILTVICDPPPSPTPTNTSTVTPTVTITATNTPTVTRTATNTPTVTATATLTPTPTTTSTTPTPTPTNTVTPTFTTTGTVTPTVTSTKTATPTPTPTIMFNSSLTISSSYIPVSSNGVTFNALNNDKLQFLAIQSLSGNAQTMMLFINSQQVAQIDFASDYLGKNCRYFNNINGNIYTIVFVNGNVNL